VDGTTYHAEFTMASTCTDPNLSVQTRLRVNQKGSWQSWDRVVNSNNQQGPSAVEDTTYGVVFAPRITGTDDNHIVASMDQMSFSWDDDTSSWLQLKTFTLEEIEISP
jgi:hypothetical protein